jgi:hypothetical protein
LAEIDHCGRGDPIGFDPEQFIFQRLQEMEPFETP